MKAVTFSTILTLTAMVTFFTAVAQDAKTGPKAEGAAAAKSERSYKNIGVEAFDRLRQSKTNVVLDVRTKKEYQEGHLPGAVLIDITGDDFDKEIARLDKNKTYLVHCAVGGRSARACKKMEQLGFKSLYNLEGGINAWQKAGKQVEK